MVPQAPIRLGDSGARWPRQEVFQVTGKGMKVVQETQQTLTRLWQGLPKLQGGKA